MPEANLQDINFALLGPENLVRLGEDFARALPLVIRDPPRSRMEEGWIDSITEAVSKDEPLKTRVSPQEAAMLAETFRQALQRVHLSDAVMRDLWVRVHAHALLRGLYIFPDVEICAEGPKYVPLGFMDVWRGNYRGNPVCIKAIRSRNTAHLGKIKKIFYHEVEGCKHFSHPNILPIVRISENLFPFCIMSPWMPGGNIIQYIERNPSANRLMLLAEVCRGLSHLHGLELAHGCIAPGNILVTRDGRACIGDFGIVGAFADLSFPRFKLGTARYMAVERLDFFGSAPSMKSDVYSLAMTSFTVLTGVTPYEGITGHFSLLVRIKSGERPSRPTTPDSIRWLQDRVWVMITACWNEDPKIRYEVAMMYELFSTLSLQEVQKVQSDIKTGGQQRPSGIFRPRITSLFQFLLVSEPEIKRIVNEMDERLEDPNMPDRDRLKLLNELCKKCSRHRVIPKSMHIPDFSSSNDASRAEYFGGFANIFKSTYEGHTVAVKVIRVFTTNLNTILSGFCREVVAWKHLRHPNILPLIGVTVSENRFAMVSEWMENGNINEFVRKDPEANRTVLLAEVASGLKYMHDLRIVHGDLKGGNILINKEKRACIADFSLTTITGVGTQSPGASLMSTLSDDTLMSFTGGGTYRWMSPELLDPERFRIPQIEGERPTRQSDCYALGMVVYEVLCGYYPFIEIENNILLLESITNGVRPKKPEGAARLGFSNELWMIVERCWRENRDERPIVEEILNCLNDSTAFWYMRGF